MRLLVDIGNSRIKWAEEVDGQILPGKSIDFPLDGMEAFPGAAMEQLAAPRQILVSNVAGPRIEGIFRKFCLVTWSLHPEFMTVTGKAAGVTNGYDDVRQLGVDRWMALLAAWHFYSRPVCIIDCGTALTLDLLGRDGKHIGGYIIPGPATMVQSLMNRTSQIESNVTEGRTLLPGRTTSDCVNNGTIAAVVAFVNTGIYQLQQLYEDDLAVVVTGGAAGALLKFLPDGIDHDPCLVLRGISIAAGEKS